MYEGMGWINLTLNMVQQWAFVNTIKKEHESLLGIITLFITLMMEAVRTSETLIYSKIT
jgi:hypothetical protein